MFAWKRRALSLLLLCSFVSLFLGFGVVSASAAPIDDWQDGVKTVEYWEDVTAFDFSIKESSLNVSYVRSRKSASYGNGFDLINGTSAIVHTFKIQYRCYVDLKPNTVYRLRLDYLNILQDFDVSYGFAKDGYADFSFIVTPNHNSGTRHR